MDRALYDRLGARAPAAIRIAKAHRVSVPALLGAMAGVTAGLLADREGYTADTAEAKAAVALLLEHPDVGTLDWPACPSGAELAAERTKRMDELAAERVELAERKAAAWAKADEAKRERVRKANELARAEARQAAADELAASPTADPAPETVDKPKRKRASKRKA